jgi:hypothetical protein
MLFYSHNYFAKVKPIETPQDVGISRIKRKIRDQETFTGLNEVFRDRKWQQIRSPERLVSVYAMLYFVASRQQTIDLYLSCIFFSL